MANRIIFAGGEIDCLRITSGSPVEVTTAGSFDPTYARCSISMTSDSELARCYFIEPDSSLANVVTGETLWFHCEVQMAEDAGVNRGLMELIDNATGYAYFAFRCPSQNNICVAGNTGTGAVPVWTTLAGSTVTHNHSARNIVDMMWTLGSPHQIAFYWNNNFMASGTFTNAGAVSIGGFTLRAMSDSRASRWSQFLVTVGIPTVLAKVFSARPSAAGASNTFASGVFGDISEIAYNDVTALASNAAGQKYTMACSDITVTTGYTIQSVFLWSRAKHGGASPTNLKQVIRSSGVDYPSPNGIGMNIGMHPIGAQFATNPAGGAWTQTNFNAIEIGGESAA
jgi:hypothetical protein